MVRMRCGGRSARSTAVAATASGGATIAPSTTAAAQGSPGTIAWATAATAAVVRPTATTTSPSKGAQLSRRSRNEASNAASSRTGATNRASTSSGGKVGAGAPGTNASRAPPIARNTGYGAPAFRAAAASSTAATNIARTCSAPAPAAVCARQPQPQPQPGAPAGCGLLDWQRGIDNGRCPSTSCSARAWGTSLSAIGERNGQQEHHLSLVRRYGPRGRAVLCGDFSGQRG